MTDFFKPGNYKSGNTTYAETVTTTSAVVSKNETKKDLIDGFNTEVEQIDDLLEADRVINPDSYVPTLEYHISRGFGVVVTKSVATTDDPSTRGIKEEEEIIAVIDGGEGKYMDADSMLYFKGPAFQERVDLALDVIHKMENGGTVDWAALKDSDPQKYGKFMVYLSYLAVAVYAIDNDTTNPKTYPLSASTAAEIRNLVGSRTADGKWGDSKYHDALVDRFGANNPTGPNTAGPTTPPPKASDVYATNADVAKVRTFVKDKGGKDTDVKTSGEPINRIQIKHGSDPIVIKAQGDRWVVVNLSQEARIPTSTPKYRTMTDVLAHLEDVFVDATPPSGTPVSKIYEQTVSATSISSQAMGIKLDPPIKSGVVTTIVGSGKDGTASASGAKAHFTFAPSPDGTTATISFTDGPPKGSTWDFHLYNAAGQEVAIIRVKNVGDGTVDPPAEKKKVVIIDDDDEE